MTHLGSTTERSEEQKYLYGGSLSALDLEGAGKLVDDRLDLSALPKLTNMPLKSSALTSPSLRDTCTQTFQSNFPPFLSFGPLRVNFFM